MTALGAPVLRGSFGISRDATGMPNRFLSSTLPGTIPSYANGGHVLSVVVVVQNSGADGLTPWSPTITRTDVNQTLVQQLSVPSRNKYKVDIFIYRNDGTSAIGDGSNGNNDYHYIVNASTDPNSPEIQTLAAQHFTVANGTNQAFPLKQFATGYTNVDNTSTFTVTENIQGAASPDALIGRYDLTGHVTSDYQNSMPTYVSFNARTFSIGVNSAAQTMAPITFHTAIGTTTAVDAYTQGTANTPLRMTTAYSPTGGGMNPGVELSAAGYAMVVGFEIRSDDNDNSGWSEPFYEPRSFAYLGGGSRANVLALDSGVAVETPAVRESLSLTKKIAFTRWSRGEMGSGSTGYYNSTYYSYNYPFQYISNDYLQLWNNEAALTLGQCLMLVATATTTTSAVPVPAINPSGTTFAGLSWTLIKSTQSAMATATSYQSSQGMWQHVFVYVSSPLTTSYAQGTSGSPVAYMTFGWNGTVPNNTVVQCYAVDGINGPESVAQIAASPATQSAVVSSGSLYVHDFLTPQPSRSNSASLQVVASFLPSNTNAHASATPTTTKNWYLGYGEAQRTALSTGSYPSQYQDVFWENTYTHNQRTYNSSYTSGALVVALEFVPAAQLFTLFENEQPNIGESYRTTVTSPITFTLLDNSYVASNELTRTQASTGQVQGDIVQMSITTRASAGSGTPSIPQIMADSAGWNNDATVNATTGEANGFQWQLVGTQVNTTSGVRVTVYATYVPAGKTAAYGYHVASGADVNYTAVTLTAVRNARQPWGYPKGSTLLPALGQVLQGNITFSSQTYQWLNWNSPNPVSTSEFIATVGSNADVMAFNTANTTELAKSQATGSGASAYQVVGVPSSSNTSVAVPTWRNTTNSGYPINTAAVIVEYAQQLTPARPTWSVPEQATIADSNISYRLPDNQPVLEGEIVGAVEDGAYSGVGKYPPVELANITEAATAAIASVQFTSVGQQVSFTSNTSTPQNYPQVFYVPTTIPAGVVLQLTVATANSSSYTGSTTTYYQYMIDPPAVSNLSGSAVGAGGVSWRRDAVSNPYGAAVSVFTTAITTAPIPANSTIIFTPPTPTYGSVNGTAAVHFSLSYVTNVKAPGYSLSATTALGADASTAATTPGALVSFNGTLTPTDPNSRIAYSLFIGKRGGAYNTNAASTALNSTTWQGIDGQGILYTGYFNAVTSSPGGSGTAGYYPFYVFTAMEYAQAFPANISLDPETERARALDSLLLTIADKQSPVSDSANVIESINYGTPLPMSGESAPVLDSASRSIGHPVFIDKGANSVYIGPTNAQTISQYPLTLNFTNVQAGSVLQLVIVQKTGNAGDGATTQYPYNTVTGSDFVSSIYNLQWSLRSAIANQAMYISVWVSSPIQSNISSGSITVTVPNPTYQPTVSSYRTEDLLIQLMEVQGARVSGFPALPLRSSYEQSQLGSSGTANLPGSGTTNGQLLDKPLLMFFHTDIGTYINSIGSNWSQVSSYGSTMRATAYAFSGTTAYPNPASTSWSNSGSSRTAYIAVAYAPAAFQPPVLSLPPENPLVITDAVSRIIGDKQAPVDQTISVTDDMRPGLLTPVGATDIASVTESASTRLGSVIFVEQNYNSVYLGSITNANNPAAFPLTVSYNAQQGSILQLLVGLKAGTYGSGYTTGPADLPASNVASSHNLTWKVRSSNIRYGMRFILLTSSTLPVGGAGTVTITLPAPSNSSDVPATGVWDAFASLTEVQNAMMNPTSPTSDNYPVLATPAQGNWTGTQSGMALTQSTRYDTNVQDRTYLAVLASGSGATVDPSTASATAGWAATQNRSIADGNGGAMITGISYTGVNPYSGASYATTPTFNSNNYQFLAISANYYPRLNTPNALSLPAESGTNLRITDTATKDVGIQPPMGNEPPIIIDDVRISGIQHPPETEIVRLSDSSLQASPIAPGTGDNTTDDKATVTEFFVRAIPTVATAGVEQENVVDSIYSVDKTKWIVRTGAPVGALDEAVSVLDILKVTAPATLGYDGPVDFKDSDLVLTDPHGAFIKNFVATESVSVLDLFRVGVAVTSTDRAAMLDYMGFPTVYVQGNPMNEYTKVDETFRIYDASRGNSTTDEWWSFDNISLHQYAWNITTIGGSRFGVPPLRGEDVQMSNRPGRIWVPKTPDSRVITLIMWMAAIDPNTNQPPKYDQVTQWNDNWNFLRRLFYSPKKQKVLTRRWKLNRLSPRIDKASAKVQLGSTMDPSMTGRTRSEFAVDLVLADPYFYGPQLIETIPVTLTSNLNAPNVRMVYNPGDDTAGPTNMTVTFYGPLTNPRLVNKSGPHGDLWMKLLTDSVGTIPQGDNVTFNIEIFRAVRTGTGAVVTAAVRHSGDTPWFALSSGDNLCVLEADAGTGYATISYNPPYV